MTNTLALDPATVTGYAHSNGQHGTWDLSRNRFPEFPGGRWCKLEDEIYTAHEQWGPLEMIVIEESSFGGNHRKMQMTTIAFHNKLRGIVEMIACDLRAVLMAVPITSLKSWAAGNGHAPKQQMIAALKTQFGITVTDDNEADAIWLLKFSQQPQIPERPKVQKQRVRKSLAKAPRLF